MTTTPQRRFLAATSAIDLIVSLHVRRLVGEPRLPDFETTLPLLVAKAGIDEQTAAAADAIADVCDRLALRFCYEEPHSGLAGGYSYELDARVSLRRPVAFRDTEN